VTVAEAAKAYAKAKKDAKKAELVLEAAGEVLKAYHAKTGRSDYKGLIGFAQMHREVLDQKKVKAHLGSDLPKFMKPSDYVQLSVLR
jgi:hypothetical protein